MTVLVVDERNVNLYIYVCATQGECDAYAATALCGVFAGPPVYPKLPHRVTCSQMRYGRFLRIRHLPLAATHLALCEVQAFF